MAFDRRRMLELRTKRNLSMQKVADEIGISKAHVWNLEKGIAENPSMELVVKLARLFRVGVADLVGENPNDPEEAPEMVAMFRDLKQLEPRDRETIRLLMERMAGDKRSDG